MNSLNIEQKTEKNKSSKIKSLEEYLKSKYSFRLNEIKNRIEMTAADGGVCEAETERDIWRDVNLNFRETSVDSICNLLSSNFTLKYNPLKAFFESLPEAESFFLGEHDPIAQLCSYIEVEYERDKNRLYFAFLNFFVGAIKTLYSPTYVHKQALIFQGPSGIGKTPFVSSLLPEELREYVCFNPTLDPRIKDSKISLTRNILVVLDEIDDFFKSKQNRNNYKYFMSQKIITERLPYARIETSRQRIASFLGTCNESTFLSDPTGSQRFSIFAIVKFHNRRSKVEGPCIEDFDVRGCWSFAYQRFLEGFDPEYSSDELRENEVFNERYKYNSPEFDLILDFIGEGERMQRGSEFMTTTRICSSLNSLQEDIVFSVRGVGQALVRLGWEKSKLNDRYGYWVRFKTNFKQKNVQI